jgi:acid phosphatase (class A)
MTMDNMKPANPRTIRKLPAILVVVALAIFAIPLHADDSSYLPPGQPDSIAILPPPPLPGSTEQAADLATVVSVHNACTPKEMAVAISEEKINVFTFAPAIGTFFQAHALPRTEAFFRRVTKTADPVQEAAKVFYKRTRPYVVDPRLAVAHPENSFSYPSAHSTYATVCALILADLFPDKRAEILEIGRKIGWHRVQLGKHYPTDVYAGRVVALAVVSALKSNPGFQKDFAAVKEECNTVRTRGGHVVPGSQPNALPTAQPAHASP